MLKLSLQQINSRSPYQVSNGGSIGLFKFASDSNVLFGVAFEKDNLLRTGESYQFAITNYEGKKSPRDPKVRETILAIVEEFFAENQAALLYICETGDGMQKMRNRLFRSWFGVYGENDDYLYLPMVVFDDEDNENYTALILRKDHPHFKEVVSEFTQTINMLNNKPESV